MSCIIHFQLRNKLRFNEVTVSSTSQDLGTCQQPSRLSHNAQATKKHWFSNSSQSLISHGSYFREDLIRRNLHSCSSSLIVLRYIYINVPKTSEISNLPRRLYLTKKWKTVESVLFFPETWKWRQIIILTGIICRFNGR